MTWAECLCQTCMWDSKKAAQQRCFYYSRNWREERCVLRESITAVSVLDSVRDGRQEAYAYVRHIVRAVFEWHRWSSSVCISSLKDCGLGRKRGLCAKVEKGRDSAATKESFWDNKFQTLVIGGHFSEAESVRHSFKAMLPTNDELVQTPLTSFELIMERCSVYKWKTVCLVVIKLFASTSRYSMKQFWTVVLVCSGFSCKRKIDPQELLVLCGFFIAGYWQENSASWESCYIKNFDVPERLFLALLRQVLDFWV